MSAALLRLNERPKSLVGMFAVCGGIVAMSIVRGPLNASFSKMPHRMPTLEGCTRFFPKGRKDDWTPSC